MKRASIFTQPALAIALISFAGAALAAYPDAPSPVESSPAVAISAAEFPPATEISETAEVAANENESAAGAPDPCPPKKKAALKKAAASAYAPLFYDNEFDYLLDDCYNGCLLGDDFKRLGVGRCWVVDVGGQYRLRYHNEHNHRGLGLTGRDDEFLLHRTRLYINAEYGDSFRAYFEGIDAESNHEDFAPRPIEVNRTDILNAFADLKLHEGACGDLWVRAGRQELLYGNERAASPLDWANTRRTFEGVKLFYKGQDWNADVFWTQPVPVDDHGLDSPDQSQEFLGAYTTYKGTKDHTLDFYFLRLSETAGTDFYFNTFGTRWLGKAGDWMAEVEGMYQFGRFGAADHDAPAFVAGIGRNFPCAAWKPTLWAYYDWSSGDETIGNGYHHLFPLSHKYWGWMDLFGFRNLEDLNFQLTAQPTEKLKLTAWWHIFNLQDGADVPYTVTMAPFVATPGGDQRLGQELDLTANWSITPRLGALFGYSHFFAGPFYATNPAAPFNGDADFYYVQMHVNF